MEYMTLYEFAEKTYNELSRMPDWNSLTLIKKTDFEDMVGDDSKCIDLMKKVLEFDFGNLIDSRYKYRANHILITWLLGLGLGKYFNLSYDSGSIVDNLFYDRLWLQTAMLHDYGYFRRKELENGNLSLNELTKEYDLLTDSYSSPLLECLNEMSKGGEFSKYFTYTYDEIVNYYHYAQEYLYRVKFQNSTEKNDHGIIGGCIAFTKYCKRIHTDSIGPSDVITQIQKIACITAASHNIFKSSDDKDDEHYRDYNLNNLLSTSPKRIGVNNKLLLLLSLVDTIECTKRFSASTNPQKYLQQQTTIKRVKLMLDDHTLFLDFSPLKTYLENNRKSQDMVDELIKHVNCVNGLNSWTAFETHENASNDMVVGISLA